jgi:hypothetical protein
MPAETDPTNIADSAAAESKKDTGNKKKQIVVALLLVGLIVAILTQPEKNDTATGQIVGAAFASAAGTPVKTVASPQVPASQADATESVDARIQRLGQVRELSRIELDDITKLEFFAPEPLRVQEKFVNDTQRVQAVYGTSSGHAALLGDSILRRGQPLPHGGKVLQVTPEGIQVAP